MTLEQRELGRTGAKVSVLGFGASSLGAEFREIDWSDALRCVPTALDCGINLIDTAPFYGRGQSEIFVGAALRGIPRDSYYLSTKLGRYSREHFDFSARRVRESVDISLERLRTDYLDIMLCHDVEFGDLNQIIHETLPALQQIQASGKVRWLGISGYPMKIFREVTSQFPLDVVLSYNHYTLQNTLLAELIPSLQQRGIGLLNAAPFSARLLSDEPLPQWHRAPAEVRERCAAAAEHCRRAGQSLAQLAVQFSVSHSALATCIVGTANPQRIGQWAKWAGVAPDRQLLEEVLQILQPIHNWRYIEGRPENNDEVAT